MNRSLAHLGTTLASTIMLVSFVQPVYAANATLSLSPATQTVNVGDEIKLVVDINTDGAATTTTDFYVTYDATKLILTDITPGIIYDQYIGKEINNATGVGSITGLASSTTKLFTGTGTFATLTFKGIAPGSPQISIKHTPGDRNDTNVVDIETNNDILSSVTPATITLSGTAPTPTVLPSPTINTNPTNIPTTASSLPTLFMVISSMILLGMGVFVYKSNL